MAIGDSVSDPALNYECDLTAERDRLRAENVKWLTALQEIDTMHGDGDAAFGRCLHIAREALAKPAA